jgi:hypothetical protein
LSEKVKYLLIKEKNNKIIKSLENQNDLKPIKYPLSHVRSCIKINKNEKIWI